MKAVPDTMFWVSYATHRDGPRHQALERAWRARVRLFTSPYILSELSQVLIEDFGHSRRYADEAVRAVLRRARPVELPATGGSFVAVDPADNPIVQTALTAKADCVVTADRALLAVAKVLDVEIVTLDQFVLQLPPEG
jgi:predicted nucleic acid-binding protein